MDLANAYMNMMDDISGLEDENKVIEVLKAYLDGESTTINGKVYNSDGDKIANEKLSVEITDVISFVRHNFGLGLFTTIDVDDITLVDNPSSPQVTVDMKGNLEVPVGLAYDFGSKDQFVIGGSVRYIVGAGASTTIDSGDLADLAGDNNDVDTESVLGVEQYAGVSVNLGTIWKTNKLNYALTVNDLFSSLEVDKYNDAGDKVNSTESLESNVSIAISNKYHDYERDGNWFTKNIFWTAELKNIFSADLDGDGEKDDNFWKKIHLGTDTVLLDNKFLDFDLRVGLNEGYFTFGFGTELFSFLNIEYSNYTRELGPHLGMKPERLHSLGFNFRI
jgi:hypothetical protein